MPNCHEQITDRGLRQRHHRVALGAGTVALVMLGMAFAAVPLYRMFCQVTGFAGTTQRASTPSTHIIGKHLIVRFDANVSGGLAWKFEPVKQKLNLKIGENRIALFRAKNLSSKTLTGTASFNVAPDAAGAYFNKLECFCFTEQTLKPGQSVEMPVSFYIDPEFAKNRATRGISQVTLSYTFFPVTGGEANIAGQRETKKGS